MPSTYATSSVVQFECPPIGPEAHPAGEHNRHCQIYVVGCYDGHELGASGLVRHFEGGRVCLRAHPDHCGVDHPDGEDCLGWICSANTRRAHTVHNTDAVQQCSNCNGCIGWHCHCYTCRECNRRCAAFSGGICAYCCRCDGGNGCNSCECHYCEDCGNTISPDYWNGDHDCCTNCARERRGRAVTFRSPRTPTFFPADKSRRRENKSARFAALEIEVASAEPGDAIDDVARKWNAGIVEDGSLPSGGFEINTSPAAGDVLLEQINDWATALKLQDATTDQHCGLHVHVDAQDFKHYDIRHLILLYELVEPTLFAMVPRWRKHSTYCHPCGTKYGDAVRNARMPKLNKKMLVNGVYRRGTSDRDVKSTIDMAKHSKYASERYHALNIHSWFYRGTVELRLPPGTVNETAMRSWALLMVALVDKANVITEHELGELGKLTPEEVLRAITPASIHAWITRRLSQNRSSY